MVRGSELALVLAVCDETSGRLVPLRYGYLRVFLDDTGEVFLAITPVDVEVNPVAVKLDLTMTLEDAIEVIGADGGEIANWLQKGAA